MNLFSPHKADFYKVSHSHMFPEGLEYLYGNFTPRSDKLAKVLSNFDHKVLWVGLQAYLQESLIEGWNESFFNVPKELVIEKIRSRMDNSLGKDSVTMKRWEDLHDLGYLPVSIKSLPEGSRVNIKVAPYTIINTHPDFAWVPQYLETDLSAGLWKTMSNATVAYEYKRLLLKYADETGVDPSFVDIQGHDFSARGMSGFEDAARSGMAHLANFTGTDTIAAIDYIEDYYPNPDKIFIGGSIPATEHSVSASNIILIAESLKEKNEWNGWTIESLDLGPDNPVNYLAIAELMFMRYMLTVLYPSGPFSYVSDTYDFWAVIGPIAQKNKEQILSRNGKIVFRPDSGDPIKIVLGDPNYEGVGSKPNELWRDLSIQMGAVNVLWEVFGGTVNAAGYKELDLHVGLIYGDSISLERAEAILEGLKKAGFASSNIVFGIGSFTYQYLTRDSFGTAVKATYMEVSGKGYDLFKDPKTDTGGFKKSAKGLITIEKEGNGFVQYDQQTKEQEQQGDLVEVFRDSNMTKLYTWKEIKERIWPTE